MEYPTLLVPKNCTPLQTNCNILDNLYINITTPDKGGNNTPIYSGYCKIKFTDSDNIPIEESLNIDENELDISAFLMEEDTMFLPTNDSVLTDLSCSSNIEPEKYEFESHNTVAQHNTNLSQNVYNYKDTEELSRGTEVTNELNIENEFESAFLPQLPEEKRNEAQTKDKKENNFVPSENNALKQLMSTDLQSTSMQRKTIMFMENDSHLAQTDISYNDPTIQCSELEVDNEVIIDSSSSRTTPLNKKYQCDKCKQTFDQISAFRQHMVRNHKQSLKAKVKKDSFVCKECGKIYREEWELKLHCSGHGDPDLECPTCHKVYASKFTLRAHLKIHMRKFCCTFCSRTYVKAEDLNSHLERKHLMFVCDRKQCSFITQEATIFNEHVCENDAQPAEFDNGVISDVDFITENFNPEDFKETQYTEGMLDFDGDDNGEGEISEENLNSNDTILQTTEDTEHICTDSAMGKVISNKINFDDDEDNFDEDKDIELDEQVTEQNLKSNIDSKKTQDSERIRKADSVLAKVRANDIFLRNSKKIKKHSRYNKACEVCCKKFDRIGDLKRHLIEHVIRSTLAKSPISKSGTLKIVCEICRAKTFTKVDTYKGHLREHADLTIYKCTVCDKSFSDSSNFSKHKKIHGFSYFQCDLCQRKFNSKERIAQHMEYHMENKPVKCKFCNKKFHFPSMLNKHMKNAHVSDSSSIKIKCQFCESSFTALKDKWDHEWNVHHVRKTIIDCMICDSKFRKYVELKRHCHAVHNMNIPLAKHLLKKKRRH